MQVGTIVAYSVQFLKSIGMSHSDMARARGTVVKLQCLSESCILASIKWDNPDMPKKVNIKNLAKVGANTSFCQC